MENFCYIDSICYKLKYFNRISMILSSICHINVDHCQQCCHLQFIMVYADMEIGLRLNLKNNNIRICITSEIKKFLNLGHTQAKIMFKLRKTTAYNIEIAKKDFYFFLICPNLESAGLRNYSSKISGLMLIITLTHKSVS